MEFHQDTELKNLYSSNVLGRILFSENVIRRRVEELGKRITEDYKDKELVLISVLRGGVIFLTDLSRNIDLELSIDFIGISTYQGSGITSTGIVKITKDLEEPIEGKDVLIVEDIIDTGLTVNYLLRNLKARNPASLQICSLLDRDVRRIANINIKYKGFTIGQEFVVGYGLDYKQKYRNLNAIFELNKNLVKKDMEFIQSNKSEIE